jgi:hypothetical protein
VGCGEEKMNRIIYSYPFLIFLIVLFVGCLCLLGVQIAAQQDSVRTLEIEGRVKTVYGTDGRPVNQSQDAKGFHRVTGSVKLASGRAILSFNSSTENGKQDVSFISASTYIGKLSVTDTTNSYTYYFYPLSGKQAMIKSSSGTDTTTVHFIVERE